MKLQKILFPTEEICDETRMYFNGSNFDIDNGAAVINPGGILDTDTYFNSFSIKKWLKYTSLRQTEVTLDVEGTCNIYLSYVWIDKDNIIRRRGDNKPAFVKETKEREKVKLKFQPFADGEISYFRIGASADSSVKFFGGWYDTELEPEVENVKIAIGICTFRREEFIERNLKAIRENILDNRDSLLYNKLEVFISDNGQSLDLDKTNGRHIRCVYNANLGGSGGFTRCMIEAKKKQEELGLTNIILMDDDILLDTNVLERTYAFLSMLRPDHRNSLVGGGMLILSDKSKQFENAALYYGGMLKFDNKNLDLKPIRSVIRNERPHDVNYNAWCYCCMPLDKITFDNLPMPFFIHMDDVEYGVRSKLEIITMNGICVWHPFFANQRGASIVYYDVRNKLITMSELGGMHIQDYAKFYVEVFYKYIFNYDYKRTLVACKAISDYCRGIDYFKNIDPLQLHKELGEYNPVWVDDDCDMKSRIDNSQSVNYLSTKGLIKNYLLPAKRKEIVVDCDISQAFPYRAKRLVIYNHVTGKYAVFKKSFIQMMRAKLACRKAKKVINKKLLDCSWEWNERIPEITCIDFWNKYLGIEETK